MAAVAFFWLRVQGVMQNWPASLAEVWRGSLLAGWYLQEPYPMSPPRVIPQPAGGGDRNAVPLYDFPSQRIVQPMSKAAFRERSATTSSFAL